MIYSEELNKVFMRDAPSQDSEKMILAAESSLPFMGNCHGEKFYCFFI